MEEFSFDKFKITDRRIKISEHNIDAYNLLEFLFLSMTPMKIARVFNNLIDDGVIEIDVDNEYEVEAILDDSIVDGEKLYLIKWKNWHIEFSTWEPISNLKNCKQQFVLYEKRKIDQTKIMDEYAQPKNELIRQVMSVITNCSVTHKDVQKYLKINGTKRAVKRHSSDLLLANKKRPRHSITTQKQTLEEWQTLINKKYPIFNVKVENNQDTEGPPLDYEFITDYVSTSVQINVDPPFGCCCTKKCMYNKECLSLHGTKTPYTVAGKIRIPTGVPVYECNKACSCTISCPFRVVQRGAPLDLTVFRTLNRGWGLKTRNVIKSGSFIIEYLGEIITVDEAEERGALYDKQNLTYLFDLDFAGDPEFTIDAYKKGNLAHFINHSCDPNMTNRCVYINCLDPRLPRIAFFAARDIKAGEELSFDYMMTGAINEDPADGRNDHDESLSSASIPDSVIRSSIVSDAVSNSTTSVLKRVKCLCKAKNCRKYLY